ncbi:MAG: ubiquitin-conjugating enzyme family protein [Candidatus Korarchaeota archaeon]
MPQLPEERFKQRIAKEKELVREYLPTFKIIRESSFGIVLRGTIDAPPDSIYAGEKFDVEIELGRNFPFSPPVIKWWTPTWHPNIAPPDRAPPYPVCISTLSTKWVPTMYMPAIVEALRAMLSTPNPRSPLNSAAAQQLLYDPETYRATVKRYMMKV